MSKRTLNPDTLENYEDWEGNNAAFTCPADGCGKVFIVSGMIHRGVRECPSCSKSTGYVVDGKKNGGKAYIEW